MISCYPLKGCVSYITIVYIIACSVYFDDACTSYLCNCNDLYDQLFVDVNH